MRVAAFIFIFLVSADPAFAYMGPGAGLAFIGSLLALVAALGIGALGLVWYPIKRLIRMRNSSEEQDNDPS
jgi:hypothetical protein